MGRGWQSRVSSSKGGKKALYQKRREQGELSAIAISGEHDSECVVPTVREHTVLGIEAAWLVQSSDHMPALL